MPRSNPATGDEAPSAPPAVVRAPMPLRVQGGLEIAHGDGQGVRDEEEAAVRRIAGADLDPLERPSVDACEFCESLLGEAGAAAPLPDAVAQVAASVVDPGGRSRGTRQTWKVHGPLSASHLTHFCADPRPSPRTPLSSQPPRPRRGVDAPALRRGRLHLFRRD